MSTFYPLSKEWLNNKETLQYIFQKGIISVDKLGDMCIKDIDCLIALCSKRAITSHIAKSRYQQCFM